MPSGSEVIKLPGRRYRILSGRCTRKSIRCTFYSVSFVNWKYFYGFCYRCVQMYGIDSILGPTPFLFFPSITVARSIRAISFFLHPTGRLWNNNKKKILYYINTIFVAVTAPCGIMIVIIIIMFCTRNIGYNISGTSRHVTRHASRHRSAGEGRK